MVCLEPAIALRSIDAVTEVFLEFRLILGTALKVVGMEIPEPVCQRGHWERACSITVQGSLGWVPCSCLGTHKPGRFDRSCLDDWSRQAIVVLVRKIN